MTSPGDRRGSKRSLVPLTVMALAFFVPSYRACTDNPFRSAAQFATDGWFEALWIAPVFALAAIFAGLTALALRKGHVDRTLRLIGLGTLAAFALSAVGVGAAIVLGEGEWQWLAVGALTTTAAGALVRRARGHEPWQVWEHLLAAFVVLSIGSAPTIFFVGDLLSGGQHLGPGAWLFLGAQLLGSLAAAWSVAASRRSLLIPAPMRFADEYIGK
jgi:hypothetical protein